MARVVHLLAALHADPPFGWTVWLSNVTKLDANPLLREGLSPWDMAWWNTYPTVVYDSMPGLFKLFYNGLNSCSKPSAMCPSTDYPGYPNSPMTDRRIDSTLYAESVDGVVWQRPPLGQVPWPNRTSSAANNMAMECGPTDPNRGVLHDVHDPDPTRRFKAFGSFGSFDGANESGSKLGVVSSSDGRTWSGYTPVDEMQVSADTANQLLYDPHLGKYLAFSRNWCHTYTRPSCGAREWGYRRGYRSTATAVEGPWSRAVEVVRGERGYEIYSLAPWRHTSWAAGTYLAIGSFYDTVDKVLANSELMESSDDGGNWMRL